MAVSRSQQASKPLPDYRGATDCALVERFIGRPRLLGWVRFAFVIIVGFFAGRTLLQPGFLRVHDNIVNVLRVAELARCLDEGRLGCRWVANMGGGLGLPLFVYYPPFPTYVSLFFVELGLSPIDGTKFAFLAALLVAGTGMFFLARTVFGRWGGLLSATAYMLSPYAAFDIFVRGALAETWGLALLPWTFYAGAFAAKASEPRDRVKGLLAVGGTWALLLLSHLLTAITIALPYALWLLLHTKPKKAWRQWAYVACAHLFALGFAAAYVIPVLAERNFIHWDWLLGEGTPRYLGSFCSLNELVLESRDLESGCWRGRNGIPPQLGVLRSASPILLCIALAWRHTRSSGGSRTFVRYRRQVAIGLAVFTLFGVVMAHSISLPLWHGVPILAYVQFPWRFIGLATFTASAAIGGWLSLFKRRTTTVAIGGVLLGLMLWKAEPWFQPISLQIPEPELGTVEVVAGSMSGSLDYIPIEADPHLFRRTFRTLSRYTRRNKVNSTSDSAFFDHVAWGQGAIDFCVRSAAPHRVTVQSFDFPGWTARIEGKPAKLLRGDLRDDAMGRIQLALPAGHHCANLRFRRTPARAAGDATSLTSLLVAFGLLVHVYLRPKLVGYRQANM